MQAPLHTAPGRLGRQNNQAAALIWETLPKHKVSFILPLCLGSGSKTNVSNARQTYMEYVSH